MNNMAAAEVATVFAFGLEIRPQFPISNSLAQNFLTSTLQPYHRIQAGGAMQTIYNQLKTRKNYVHPLENSKKKIYSL